MSLPAIPPDIERLLKVAQAQTNLPPEWTGVVSAEQVGLWLAAGLVWVGLHAIPCPGRAA